MKATSGRTTVQDLGQLAGLSLVAIFGGCGLTVTGIGAVLGLPLLLIGVGGLLTAFVAKSFSPSSDDQTGEKKARGNTA